MRSSVKTNSSDDRTTLNPVHSPIHAAASRPLTPEPPVAARRAGRAAARASAPGAGPPGTLGGGGPAGKCSRGGGELVAHSGVCPPHGSGPAGSARSQDTATLRQKTSSDSPMTNAPTVAITLSVVHPSAAV